MQHAPCLNAYYNRLVRVQLAAKTATTMQAEIHHHLGNTAAVQLSFLGRVKNDDEARELFHQASADIIADAGREAQEIMQPVAQETMRLNLSSTRLMTLVQNPEIVTRDGYEALGRFHEQLVDASDRLRVIRMEAEAALLRASGMAPKGLVITTA